MNSAEKQRIQAAYDRAGLIAALASRGFYVIGERWRDRICGRPAASESDTEARSGPSDGEPRPAARDRDPDLDGGTASTTRR